MSKIIEMRAENIKRLSAVHIKPDGALVVIGGKCDQGKSSVLDSIQYALAGGKSLPEVPIRRGQNKGRIKLDLGDLIVERTFSSKGSTLEVRKKAGGTLTSPQKILDELCGKLAFDPLEFSRQKPKDQLAIMRDLVGIDFTALDEKRAAAFATRTNVNRDVKNLEGELAGADWHEGMPLAEVSVAELSDQLEAARQQNALNDDHREAVTNLESDIANETEGIERDQREIRDAEAELACMRERLASRVDTRDLMKESKVDLAEKARLLADVDPAPIRERISDAETFNRKVRENARRLQIAAKLDAAVMRAEELTNEIEVIDAEKQTTISVAKFPVPGLGFGEDGITFDGLPFDQAASSQRLKVSVAMGFAVNPGLRIMLIRDGSLLDAEALAVVAKMAEAVDAQIWIERVSQGDEVSVIIEDGMVRQAESVEQETAEASAT